MRPSTSSSIPQSHTINAAFRTSSSRKYEDLIDGTAAKEVERLQQDRLTHVARLTTLGEMTAGIAHEINQPLTAISMYAQSGVRMLDAGIPKPERLREALEKLTAQSLRAGAVIDRVQRLVRKQESTVRTGPLNDLINDVLRLAESDARVNDMQIALDLAHEPAARERRSDPDPAGGAESASATGSMRCAASTAAMAASST